MTDRPIIFSAPSVKATLEGRKTETRRLAWGAPFACPECEGLGVTPELFDGGAEPPCRACEGTGTLYKPTIWQKVRPGDRLWVRETFARVPATAYQHDPNLPQIPDPDRAGMVAVHAATFDRAPPTWKSPRFMPRWASRLTLTVTETRMERLQTITVGDERAEGAPHGKITTRHRWFIETWNSLHGPDAWDANPEVVPITFEVHHRNIDREEAA